MIKTFGARLTTLLAAKWFWRMTLIVFIFEALWFVFSAAYPMAFDEDFHFGIIKIYSHHWSPFLAEQPANASQFGALAADPSYFFHYLMSFPLRFIALCTDNQAAQVIFLRLINVGLVAGALLLFRKLLLRVGSSAAFTNTSIALLVLVPIMPQLAAHINYDNLLMLLLAWLCLVVVNLVEGFQQKRVDAQALLLFVIICLGMSIVKYAALPLLVGAVLFVGIMAFRAFRKSPRALWKNLLGSFRRLSRISKIVLLGCLLVGSILFAQRYVVNLVRYHTPVPDCGQVLTVNECKQYGPWGRDYNFEHSKDAHFKPNNWFFVFEWFKGMRHRLFFAVSGSTNAYVNRIELPLPVATFSVLFVLCLLITVIWWRQIFAGQPYLLFFGLVAGIYTLALFLDQYGMYVQTAVPVAINGRYMIPVALLLAVIAGRGIGIVLARLKATQLKPYLAVLVLLLFLQGGGILTYLLRSDDEGWYWNNHALRSANSTARKVIAPFVIEGDKYANWH